MKSRLLILAALILGLIAPLRVGADDAKVESSQSQPAEEKESKKNTTVLELAAAPDKVHAAALQVLAALGATVKKDTPKHIDAKLADKDGGAKLAVSIKALKDGKTELKVSTKKGAAGEKRYDEEVANKVRDALK